MAICQYFQKGGCRFGSTCRNEHTQTSSSAFGAASGSRSTSAPASYTVESMRKDFTPRQEKPIWPLSSYSAGKGEPNLVTGLEMSFEEMRVKAWEATKAGTPNDYVSFETTQSTAADQVYSNALNNVQEAYNQAVATTQGVSSNSTTAAPAPTQSAFGAQPSSSVFGQPSTTTTSAFGNATPSVFGTPTAPRTSAFATPVAPASAFAPPSVFGSTTPAGTPASTFSQTSSLIRPSSGAFGGGATSGGGFAAFANQPSVFGAPAPPSSTTQTGSVFGPGGSASSTGGVTSAFGVSIPPNNNNTSVFGNSTNNNASAFGNSSTSAFANSNNNNNTSVFGNSNNNSGSVFNTATTNATPTTPRVSAFANPGSSTTPAGNPLNGGSSFIQPATAFPSAFATTTSAFASPSQPGSSAFGQPATAFPSAFATTTSAFASPAPSGGSAFIQPATAFPSAFGTTSAFASPSQPASASQSTSGFGGSTTTPQSQNTAANAKPAVVGGRPDFSVNGRPSYVPNSTRYDAKIPGDYLSTLPQGVVDVFKAAKFSWGGSGVPEYIPPLELR